MGQMKRREAREAMEREKEMEKRYTGVSLVDVCALGVVSLRFACSICPRAGRYRITRLIDRYGPHLVLPDLKNRIAGDCPKQRAVSIYDRCGVFIADRLPDPKK